MDANEKFRSSTVIKGLSYDLRPLDDGSFVVVFRYGRAFETFQVVPGAFGPVDCSDRHSMPGTVFGHCRDFAAALAAKLATRKAVAA